MVVWQLGQTPNAKRQTPNAKRMKEAAVACAPDFLMIETDSPDLPPVHHDGSRPAKNFPHEVDYIARFIAKLRGDDEQILKQKSDSNLFRFLGLPE